ncbi:MAG TPA: 2Fe-2S iron-sulfur cluster binding domain-containing protein [Candidatus Dormibacteraeota bacterium]|jgi:NAD(P)H-flavin reductase/ferredoxin|nr:2Fe-2S iron-sulfur cluster binding domain-containing protein [Candidatus Dormibacteraeota bacterium]
MGLFGRTPPPSTCRVRVANAELTFEVPRNRLLLGSALDQGVAYPHNCRVGTCGSCKTRLVSGRIRPLIDFALSPLTAAELKDGCILACQSKVLGDLEIEAPIARGGGVAVQRVTGRIESAQTIAADVVDLRLRLDESFRHQPGQWVSIGARESEVRRAYSLHTPCDPAGTTEAGFYIKRLPGGAFSEWLFGADRTGIEMDLLGPFGVLGDQEIIGHNVCVAGSTGLAPVVCLIEAALEGSPQPRFTLVFGVRDAEDLFALDRLEALAQRHPGRLRVVPMLSHEPAGSRWQGGRGLVTEALTADLEIDPETTQAFLCGGVAMVDACERRLRELGVAPERVHADRFVPTGATVAAITV